MFFAYQIDKIKKNENNPELNWYWQGVGEWNSQEVVARSIRKYKPHRGV